MKRRNSNRTFLSELRKVIKSLKRMKPGEVHVLSINANYGHYQIVIGPEQGAKAKGHEHDRPIEINGEIHHLFVTPNKVQANPSKRQVLENLRDTVIMRNLSIHLCDPLGDGRHLEMPKDGNNGLHAREYINLAGDVGDELLDEAEHSPRLSLAAYRLIQKDILNALGREEAVE